MASPRDHLVLANKNHDTLAALLALGTEHSEWVATVAFYKAIHIIEATFAVLGEGHSANHEERTWKLKTKARFKTVFEHYRPLKEASTIARYLADTNGPASFRTFSDYLSPEQVHSELIRHRLHQIESSCGRLVQATPFPIGLKPSASLPKFAVATATASTLDTASDTPS